MAKFADKRLVSIVYVSEDMNQQLNNNGKAIDDALEAVTAWLPTAKLNDKQRARIRKDAESLATEIKQRLPEAGAIMGFDFLTPQVWKVTSGFGASNPLSTARSRSPCCNTSAAIRSWARPRGCGFRARITIAR